MEITLNFSKLLLLQKFTFHKTDWKNFYNFLHPLPTPSSFPSCDWQFSFHRWSQVYYQSLSLTSVMHERASGCEIKRFSILPLRALSCMKNNSQWDKFKSWIHIKVRNIAQKVQRGEKIHESMHIAMLIINYSRVLRSHSNYRI